MNTNKKGQVAIFVIIALVIVGAIIIFFAFPNIINFGGQKELSPTKYLEECISPSVKSAVNLLAMQGGDENPDGYINYNDFKVKYLCYTSEYYKTCVVQQPLLMSHFSNELSRILEPKFKECEKNLETEYRKRGYSVQTGKINSSVVLGLEKILISFNMPMTISNEQGARTFKKFDVAIDSKIYELLATATTIVGLESEYGDSEITLFMQYYPDLKIEKLLLEDGTKIYTVSDVVSGEKFMFASRSLVYPPGYS